MQPALCTTGKPVQLDTAKKRVVLMKPTTHPLKMRLSAKMKLEHDLRTGLLRRATGPAIRGQTKLTTTKTRKGPQANPDFTDLNRDLKKEKQHSPNKAIGKIRTGAMWKTVISSKKNHQGIPLAEGAKEQTRFITQEGSFEYNFLPDGVTSEGEGYTKRYNDMARNMFKNTVMMADETCIWATTPEFMLASTCATLTKTGKVGMRYNEEEFQYCKMEVNFMGFRVTPKGSYPGRELEEALQAVGVPKNPKDAREMMQTFETAATALIREDILEPLKQLLERTTEERPKWTEELDKARRLAKGQLLSLVHQGVQSYQAGRITGLITDYHGMGVAATVLQKQCKEIDVRCCRHGWWTVMAVSKINSEEEAHYTSQEGEAMGIAWAQHTCRFYLEDSTLLTIFTGHKQLAETLTRHIDTLTNGRLRFLANDIRSWGDFEITHIPGLKELLEHPGPILASELTLSKGLRGVSILNMLTTRLGMTQSQYLHLPQPEENRKSKAWGDTIKARLDSVNSKAMEASEYPRGKPLNLTRIREAGRKDFTYTCMLIAVQSKTRWPESLREFREHRAHMGRTDDVIFHADRIFISPTLRREVLNHIHDSHLKKDSVGNACRSVWWPNMTEDMRNTSASCSTCYESSMTPGGPLQTDSPPPSWPGDAIQGNIISVRGKHYSTLTDNTTCWTDVKIIRRGSDTVYQQINDWMTVFGQPRSLTTDGGPEYNTREMKNLFNHTNTIHRTRTMFPFRTAEDANEAVNDIRRLIQSTSGKQREEEHIKRNMDKLMRKKRAGYATSPQATMTARHPTRGEGQGPRAETGPGAEPLMTGTQVRVQNGTGAYPNRWQGTGTITETYHTKPNQNSIRFGRHHQEPKHGDHNKGVHQDNIRPLEPGK